MTGVDLSTAAGALALAERWRAEMVRCFERLGRFESNGNSLCALVLATHGVRRSGDDPWTDYPGAVGGNLVNILDLPEWRS